jgi:hypothetical protein
MGWSPLPNTAPPERAAAAIRSMISIRFFRRGLACIGTPMGCVTIIRTVIHREGMSARINCFTHVAQICR